MFHRINRRSLRKCLGRHVATRRRAAQATPVAYEPLENRQLLATLVGNNTVTYQDIDGDAVTVTFSRRFLTPENVNSIFTFNTGGVSGSNETPQQLRSINLTGLTAANRTNVTVSVVGAGGAANGLAHIGQIMAEGVDINDVTTAGDLGRIRAGDANARTRGMGILNVGSLGHRGTTTGAANLETEVRGSIRELRVQRSISNAEIRCEVGNIDRLTIAGSMIASSAADFAGSIYAAGRIGDVSIGGSIMGGTGKESGTIVAAGNMGNVRIGGNIIGGSGLLSGCIDGNTIASLSVSAGIFGGSGNHSGGVGTVVGNVTLGRSLVGGSGVWSGVIDVDGSGNVSIGDSIFGGAGFASGVLGHSSSSANRVSVGGGVQGGNGWQSGRIEFGTVRSVNVGGSIVGGNASEAGQVYLLSVNDVVVGRDIVGGSASGSRELSFAGCLYVGRARNVTVDGHLVSGTDETSGYFAYNGAIVAEDDIQNLTIRGNVQGNWTYPAMIQARGQQTPSGRTDFAFRSISIGGYMLFGRIYAGYALSGGRHNADAQIGTLTVGDAWLGSDLFVGVEDLTGGAYRKFTGFGVKDRDDVDARVNSITIAGRTRSSGIPGIEYGFVAEHIVSFSQEGTPLPLNGGKSNDYHLLDTVFGGLRLIEI